MKQLWSQFLFKPELLHHHIQIWILNRAWSPLPSRQSCICATLKQASGAQQPLKPGMGAGHSATDISTAVYMLLCHEDTIFPPWNKQLHWHRQRYRWGFCVCIKWVKRPSCGHCQRCYAYFTLSVYLLSPKLVCSVTMKCVCVDFMLHGLKEGYVVIKHLYVASLYFFAFVCR